MNLNFAPAKQLVTENKNSRTGLSTKETNGHTRGTAGFCSAAS